MNLTLPAGKDQAVLPVESTSRLMELAEKKRFVFLPKASRVSLRLGLPEEVNQQWERRLNRAYLDCGCDLGAAVVLASLVAYLLVLALLVRNALSVTAEVWIGLAVLVVAVVGGKLAGLYLAGARFSREAAALSRIVDDRDRG